MPPLTGISRQKHPKTNTFGCIYSHWASWGILAIFFRCVLSTYFHLSIRYPLPFPPTNALTGPFVTSLHGICILTSCAFAFQSRVIVPPSKIVVDWCVPNGVKAYTSHAYYFCIFLFVVHFLSLYLCLLLLHF